MLVGSGGIVSPYVGVTYDFRSTRQRLLFRRQSLYTHRQNWWFHWRELSDNYQPRRARFLNDNVDKPVRNDKIINSAPRKAARVLASGMMAGVTSPARPWFRLTVPNPDLAERGTVQRWLGIVENRLRVIFAKSNIYSCLHNAYEDMGVFGVTAFHVDEDERDVIRGYSYPIGQYYLGLDDTLRVDTCYRDMRMTVLQLVEKFGIDRVSKHTRQLYQDHYYDEIRQVLHVVEPNRMKLYTDGKPAPGPRGMGSSSYWLELEADEEDGILKTSGYHEFPIMAPRWQVNGEDTWGISPGMDGLGDAKILQLLERRKAQLVDLTAKPPMAGPSSLLNRERSVAPGTFTAVDVVQAGQKFEPAVMIHPQALGETKEMIADHVQRVNEIFYADLWLMMSETDRREITAREVAERHEEKMLQLGPVLERLQDELLDPLIDRVFGVMVRRKMIPPPPPELQGMPLRVEYISILTQAQKLLMTTSIERTAGFVTSIANAGRPDILDNIDWDQAVRLYNDSIGAPSDLILPEDRVAQLRQQRAAKQQQDQQLVNAQAVAKAGKDLSNTKTDTGTMQAMLAAMGQGPPQ